MSSTKALLVVLIALGLAAPAAAQQPVQVISETGGVVGGTPADAETNTEPFLARAGMRGYFFNGATWDRMRGDTTSGLWVNVKNATLAVTQSGTWTNTVTQATGTNLHMVCDSGCSSSSAPADASAFTFSTTSQTPVGGVFQTTATSNALTTGQMGAFQVTANRALFTNLRNASGTEIGTAGTPLQVSLANTGANATKILVTPDSVALPANQSTNVAQFGGTNVSTGTGAGGAGIPRITISNDSSLAANQSVNIAQMNGVATTMGAGATGAGVQRVNDVASAATGAAPPAAAIFVGGLQSGATGGFLGGIAVADTFKGVNVSTATTTLMVTGVSGRQVRVSSFHLVTAAANNVQWISGTGATCGTGTSGIGGGGTTAASGYNFAANGGIAVGTGLGQVFTTTATGDSLCVVTSAATQLSGVIAYSIY